MLTKIISGGQTGADRAALDAAIESGIAIGGSCPVGRMAEDGPISEVYALTEIAAGYRQRTRQNVMDGDATLIFYDSHPRGGTEATIAFCIKLHKPYKLIDISVVEVGRASKLIHAFIHHSSTRVLNVAGPSASKCPKVYSYVFETLRLLFQSTRRH